MINLPDDVPKYRKKSKKATPKKANHIHQSEYCVFEHTATNAYSIQGRTSSVESTIGKYCAICGKVLGICTDDDDWTSDSNLYARGVRCGRSWNESAVKELDPVTRTLPTFYLKDYWKQKFVDLE